MTTVVRVIERTRTVRVTTRGPQGETGPQGDMPRLKDRGGDLKPGSAVLQVLGAAVTDDGKGFDIGYVNVQEFFAQYGGDALGVADCSDAIDTAVAYLTARGGGRLFFPHGVYRTTRRILIGRRYCDEGEYRYYGFLVLGDHGPSFDVAEFNASHSNTTIEIVGDRSRIWGDFTSPMGPVSASGPTPPTVTLSGTPEVTTGTHIRIGITVGGLSDGTAQYRFSTDLGSTWSSPAPVPSGGGDAVLTGTGIIATFANGTYDTSNVWVSDQLITALLYYGLAAGDGSGPKIDGIHFLGRDAAVGGVPISWGDIANPAESGQMGLFLPGSNFAALDNLYFYGLDTAWLLSDVYWATVSHCFSFQCRDHFVGHRINATRIEQISSSNLLPLGDACRFTGQGFRLDGIYTEQGGPVWFPFATDVEWTGVYLEDTNSVAPNARAAIILGDFATSNPLGNDAQHVCGMRISGGFSHAANYFMDVNHATGVVVSAVECGRNDGQYAWIFRDAYSKVELRDAVHDIQQFVARHDIVNPTGFDGLTVTTTGEPLPPDDVTVIKFDRPQVDVAAMKFLGGRLTVRRNSGANYVIDGVSHVADINQARIDDDGLLVEGPAHNILTDTLNFAAAAWVKSGLTVDDVQPTPIDGDFTASIISDVADAPATPSTHQIYQLATLAATTTTFSGYFGATPGNPLRYVRLSDNSNAHTAWFDVLLGLVVSFSGSTSHAEIEKAFAITVDAVEYTVFRCALTCTPVTGLMDIIVSSSASASYQADGTGRMYWWHPSCVPGDQYASTWPYPTNDPRDGETATIPIPNLGAEWCIEIVAQPAGPQQMKNQYPGAGGWNRGAHVPLLSIGTYGAANSLELYATSDPDGRVVASVYDSAGAEKKITSGTLNAAFNYYGGPRRIAIASTGVQRPELYVDGHRSVSATSGSGTGVFNGGIAPNLLRIGSTSAGVFGGWRVREIVIRTRSATPTVESIGLYPHMWAMDRGYVARADCIAFLGDSLMQGVYDATIRPYPFGTVTAGQQAHIYAIGGNTSRQALRRWRTDIRGRGYKKMVLQIGINDIDGGFPAAEIIANITQIVKEAVIDGVHVALGTLFPTGLSAGYKLDQHTLVNTAIRALGTHSLFVFRVSLADFYAALDDPGNPGDILPAYLFSGGYPHINQVGQDVCAPVAATALGQLT